jgi:predicted small lipoprotein YifL
MKKIFAAVTLSILLALTGCGGGGHSEPPPTFVATIPSDAAVDGDIERDALGGFTVAQGVTPSVFAGLETSTGSEFRAFLDFPLTGEVPLGAGIDSATLTIFVDSVVSAGSSVPIRIELVSFPPLGLAPIDFDQTALTDAVFVPIFHSDATHDVRIDVTSLMREAQRRGLANFQIRILEDFGPVIPGLVEIDETNALAPVLEVVYF